MTIYEFDGTEIEKRFVALKTKAIYNKKLFSYIFLSRKVSQLGNRSGTLENYEDTISKPADEALKFSNVDKARIAV